MRREFYTDTIRPDNGKEEEAVYLIDYFGKGRCGYKFTSDGKIFTEIEIVKKSVEELKKGMKEGEEISGYVENDRKPEDYFNIRYVNE